MTHNQSAGILAYQNSQFLSFPLTDEVNRICNDIDLERPGSVWIITGSNMSGKTTQLETIGANLVLAFFDTPVCATSLKCTSQQLLTSMRISDNLQSGISIFYTKLLRIRLILNAVAEVSFETSSLVLIDEIFLGTKTYDRHAATVKVLEHLASQKTMTGISTQDLELADLEGKKHHGDFHNNQFENQYQDNTIHFDYLLRPGKAATSNSMRLLEMVDIIQTEKEKE